MPWNCGSSRAFSIGLDDAVGDVDDVGLRRLEHVDADGGLAVHAAADRQFRRDHLDLGDVREAHVGREQQVADVVDRSRTRRSAAR